mgnify:FL=1
MSELKVVVEQIPGSVTWNYEELKVAIQESLAVYKNMVYDDSSITAAKKDRAMLNKLAKSVDDRKKEIKKKCLEPFNMIDAQAKELISIIKEPIDVIDTQLTAYENARRERVKKEILEYMYERFTGIPTKIAEKVKSKIYDIRWENASTTKSEWKNAIDKAAEETQSDLQVIMGLEERFRPYAMKTYGDTLRLSDAAAKVQELRRQEEDLIRRQKEAEEEKKRKEKEQKRRQEEAEKRMEEEKNLAARMKQPPMEPKMEHQQEAGRIIESAEKYSCNERPVHHFEEIPASPILKAENIQPAQNPTYPCIRIIGDSDQCQRVLKYIEFIGAKYEEAR